LEGEENVGADREQLREMEEQALAPEAALPPLEGPRGFTRGGTPARHIEGAAEQRAGFGVPVPGEPAQTTSTCVGIAPR
jgi:hypothetical protein